MDSYLTDLDTYSDINMDLDLDWDIDVDDASALSMKETPPEISASPEASRNVANTPTESRKSPPTKAAESIKENREEPPIAASSNAREPVKEANAIADSSVEAEGNFFGSYFDSSNPEETSLFGSGGGDSVLFGETALDNDAQSSIATTEHYPNESYESEYFPRAEEDSPVVGTAPAHVPTPASAGLSDGGGFSKYFNDQAGGSVDAFSPTSVISPVNVPETSYDPFAVETDSQYYPENGSEVQYEQSGEGYDEQYYKDQQYENAQYYEDQRYAEEQYAANQYEEEQYAAGQYVEQPYEEQPYEEQPYDEQPYEEQPYEEQPFDQQSYDQQPYEGQSFEEHPYEGQPYDEQQYTEQSYDVNSYDEQTYAEQPYEEQPYEEQFYGGQGVEYTGNFVSVEETAARHPEDAYTADQYFTDSTANNNVDLFGTDTGAVSGETFASHVQDTSDSLFEDNGASFTDVIHQETPAFEDIDFASPSAEASAYATTPSQHSSRSVFPEAHPIVCFGYGGKIAIHFPQFSKKRVHQMPISRLLGDTRLYRSLKQFPGPLTKSTKPKVVHEFIDTVANDIDLQDDDVTLSPVSTTLWKLLQVFVTHAGEDLFAAATTATKKHRHSDVGDEFSVPSALATDVIDLLLGRGVVSSDVVKEIELKNADEVKAIACEIEQLLLHGERMKAIKYAMDKQQWADALVLSANTAYHLTVVTRYAQERYQDDGALQTLYIANTGHPGNLFHKKTEETLVKPKFPGRKTSESHFDNLSKCWQKNLAVLLANSSSQSKAVIMQLGDSLWRSYGEFQAAQMCYLCAGYSFNEEKGNRIVLIGSDHLRYSTTFETPFVVQRTEIYEYSRVISDASQFLPRFQTYKWKYASLLIDFGLVDEAYQYVQVITDYIRASDKKVKRSFPQMFLDTLQKNEERLKFVAQTSNFSGKTLVSSVFDKFSDFLIGADNSEPSPASPVKIYPEAEVVADVPSVSSRSVTATPTRIEAPIEEMNKSNIALKDTQLNAAEKESGPKPSAEPTTDGDTNKNGSGEENGFVSSIFSIFRPKQIPKAHLVEGPKFEFNKETGKWECSDPSALPKAPEKAKPPPPRKAPVERSEVSKAEARKKSPATARDRPVPRGLPVRGRGRGGGRGGYSKPKRGLKSRYGAPTAV